MRALLALAAVSTLLAAPATAPSCAAMASSPCCADGMEECAGMASAGMCCPSSSASKGAQGLLVQSASERPSRSQAWVSLTPILPLPDPGISGAPLGVHGPRAREDLTSPAFSVLRI